MAHYKTIKIEGFQLDRLIDQCGRNGIAVRQVQFQDALTLTLEIDSRDLTALKKLARSTYKITVVRQGGYHHNGQQIWKRKTTLAGILIFVVFLFWQSCYIVEIRIDGYEKIGEHEIRKSMERSGFYEGCRKDTDLNKVKVDLYRNFDEIVWVGIRYTGRKADVQIVEGEAETPKRVKAEKPCNIVAERAGYIEEIIPTEGLRAKKDGAFVKKGDVLITGKIPLHSTAYGMAPEGEEPAETYVHARGEVKARIPERLVFYGERYERVKKKTGKTLWGISVNGYDMTRAMCSYEASVRTEKNLIGIVKPFPLKINLVKIEEVTLHRREKDLETVQRAAEREMRRYIRENLPKTAQILNKDLNFSKKKNIIEIGVTMETLQKIGVKEEIRVGKPKDRTAGTDETPPR